MEVIPVLMDDRKMWVILELAFYILILILSQMQFWDSSREISNWFRDYTAYCTAEIGPLRINIANYEGANDHFFFLFNAQLLLMGPRILWQWKEKHINLNLNLSLCHPMVYTLWIISCTDAKDEERENTRGRFCSCRPIHQQHNLILVCGMK